jgi:hypothetical protein
MSREKFSCRDIPLFGLQKHPGTSCSSAELQKMQYGEYQILIVPTHLPIGVNGGGGLKPYHYIIFKIDINTSIFIL